MSELIMAVPGADSLQTAVRQAREIALHSPEKWAQALHDLYGSAQNDVVFAAMDGDEAHAGRVLIQRLRESIIATATQAAVDAAEEAADEVFEREHLTQRRMLQAERQRRAISEGTP